MVIVLCVLTGVLLTNSGHFLDVAVDNTNAHATPALVWLSWVGTINVLVLIFNLVPAFPLDGGQLAHAAIWWRTGDRNRATRYTGRAGQGFALALAALGLLALAQGSSFGLIWMVLAFFLYQAAGQAVVQGSLGQRIQGITVADIMDREPVTVPAGLTLIDAQEQFFLRYRWPWFAVVDPAQHFLGVVREARIDEEIAAGRPALPVVEVLEPDLPVRIGVQAPLESLLGSEGLGRLGAMVAVDKDGVLQGVVTLAQVRQAAPARQCAPPGGTAIESRPMPSHDVLIIGAGLAGQRAALAAAQTGASVAIMSKVHPVRSHSVAAAGGINAAISVDDDWRSHAYDTVKGSDFLGDQDAIEVMCSEAPHEVMHLEHIGVTFHRNDDGEMDLRAFGGASMKRTAYVADITGQAILHVLYEQLMKHHETVERFEEWFTTSLILRRVRRCCWRDRARRAQRADGGLHGQERDPRLRRRRAGLQPDDQRADRDRRRDRAGLPDRRAADGHGDGPVPPHLTLVETGMLITEGARGEGAHLLNSGGERFMEKSAPNKMELASRDVVSRAEQIEINEGRGVGPDGAGIYLDVTMVPRKRTLEALREIVNLGRDFAGVDITREPIMIRPGQHYIMGGVKTDVDGRTPIEGLYAAGEVACVSVHGGNRLGANSLLDTLIFGRRAGEHAAARAASMGLPSVDTDAQLRQDMQLIDSIIARRRDGRRVSEIKQRARRDDEPPRRPSTATRRACSRRWRPSIASARRRGGLDRRPRHGLQPGRARRAGARLHDRLRRSHRGRRDRAQGVARRAVPHRLPRAQRRGVAQAHRHHAQGRSDRASGLLLAGDLHAVAARGAEILMPSDLRPPHRPLPPSRSANDD